MPIPLERGRPSEVVEQTLDAHVEKLEELTGGDLVAYNGDLKDGADSAIRDALESFEKRAKSRAKKLSVILTTPGGYIEIAKRIVDVLRHHYPDHVDFIIPNYAYSAGTVLALSGNQIWMDYFSVLGPIDPQIEKGPGEWVPALGYKKEFDRLIAKSLTKEGISDAELAFMMAKFDPAAMYSFEQARQLSITLLEEWLARYKFKDWKQTKTRGLVVDDDMRKKQAAKIAGLLIDPDKWHSHGHGISRQVLIQDIGLEIDDFGGNAEFNKAVRDYCKLLADYLLMTGFDGVIHSHQRFVPLIR